jgi:anti-sigma-K factor RskA
MTASDDDDLLAAELVLGLLDGAERLGAEAREASDPVFAALVEDWRERLAPMLAGAEEAPPDHVWTRISARLAANDDAPVSAAEAALRRWRAFAVSASAIAASLALVLVTRSPPEAPVPQPAPQVQAPAPMMVATLRSEDTPAVVTISATEDGRMLVTPVVLPKDRRVPELWIIPEDGKPRSLGVIRASGPSAMTVPSQQMPHVHRGATLAISQEPAGGSPTGAPTGPVIATGKISIV